mmetsp:Transcript_17831/g.53786  ORF Transcript_17831/g.53786 Transcript_17831/m.53786 type:complete len:311 (-) Transcript_17831:511-1443(-)
MVLPSRTTGVGAQRGLPLIAVGLAHGVLCCLVELERAAADLAGGTAAAFALLPLRSHPPDSLLQQPLHMAEAVILCVSILLLWPLGKRRSRTPKPANHVDRDDVLGSWLKDLDRPGHAHVAHAELARLVQLQGSHKGFPAVPGNRGHSFHHDPPSREAGKSHHVLEDNRVRTVQLRNEEIHQEDDSEQHIQDNRDGQQQLLPDNVEPGGVVHHQGYRHEGPGYLGDGVEGRVFDAQGGNGATEGQDDECHCQYVHQGLMNHTEAYEHKGGDARGKHGQVHGQRKEKERCYEREDRVGRANVNAAGARLCE